VVASAILSNPIQYNEAILGRPIDEYIEWILKPNSWGGAIELAILSELLELGLFHALMI
jgi:ubiquitin thioesterase OTU1